jgi:hypothetical protein
MANRDHQDRKAYQERRELQARPERAAVVAVSVSTRSTISTRGY